MQAYLQSPSHSQMHCWLLPGSHTCQVLSHNTIVILRPTSLANAHALLHVTVKSGPLLSIARVLQLHPSLEGVLESTYLQGVSVTPGGPGE